MYNNFKTTLNYFALAVFNDEFLIATLIAIDLYKRTMPYNCYLYKSMKSDELYQKTINPNIKINKKEMKLISYFIENKVKNTVLYLVNKKIGIDVKQEQQKEICELFEVDQFDQVQEMSENTFDCWSQIIHKDKFLFEARYYKNMSKQLENVFHLKKKQMLGLTLVYDQYDDNIIANRGLEAYRG